MSEEKRQIFREKSLEKLSSPDRLDQLLRIVRPHAWVLLAALGVGLAIAVAWSIFGRIPETASGTAILVRPKQVVAFQSPASGQIAAVEVRVGDRVRRGALLARFSLPTLQEDLEQEKGKLERLRARRDEMTHLDRELAAREKAHLDRTGQLIRQRIAIVREAAETHRSRTLSYIAEQRQNIETARQRSRDLAKLLEERHRAYEDLEQEGLSSRDRLVEVRTRLVDNELELANLDVREQSLALQENAAQEAYEDDMDLIRDLEIQLSNLELDKLKIEQKLREATLDWDTEIEESERRIARLRTQLESEGFLYSDYDGTILEISVAPGNLVGMGQRLGRMEIDDPDAELMALAYFSIREGKKIQPGQSIRVSPSTVEKERFGGMLGEVVDVTEYPVTTEAAANQIGDLEIARNLLRGESRIGVAARLESADTFTGYRWTSGEGPNDFPITAGTTAEVRVTIRERAPVTLLLPFLDSLAGR